MYSLQYRWKSVRFTLMALAMAVAINSSQAMAREGKTFISIVDVINRITGQGCTDIREIELSETAQKYEIKAFDRQGNRVKIKMDARNGSIIKINRDRD